jgi:hypothetical protein
LTESIEKHGAEKTISKTGLMKQYQGKIVDVCVYIVNDGKLFGGISKRWLYRTCTVKQLEAFIKLVLEPILGEEGKKKLEAVEKLLK